MSERGVPLGVVVVNFRSASLVAGTVATVREFAGEDARIVMVDNSPGDGAAEAVRGADREAQVIVNPHNRGYAAAVNQGLAAAGGELTLLLNPDVRGIDGAYADVLDAFADPGVGAVAARLVDPRGGTVPSCRREPRPFDLVSEDLALAERFPRWRRPRRYRMLDWDHADVRRVDAATGACLFLRRAALADVGPMDERFFVYYEETDWLIRAKRRGWRTLYLPSVAAVHAGGGSSPGADTRASLLLLESQHRYARKHFGPVVATGLRAALLGIDSARLARHSVASRPRAHKAALERIRVHLTLRAPRPS